MKSMILFSMLVLSASLVLPGVAANHASGGTGGEDHRYCGGVVNALGCVVDDGDGAANAIWRKAAPFEAGPHCLPFDDYDGCS